MHHSGMRGGGHHHHHHHHHAGGALLAGAAIGAVAASASRSRNQQPQVVVVQQQPGYATTTYAQPTTTYVAQPGPTVVVAQPQKKKKNPLPGCVACAFILAIVLCMSLIPWPGTYYRPLIFGSQKLDYVDGNFIEGVTVEGSSSVTLYAFTSLPRRDAYRTFSKGMTFNPGYRNYESLQFDLLSGSSVGVNLEYFGGCTLEFLVLKGYSRFATFQNGGYPYAEVRRTFNGILSHTYNVDYDDDYFFIVYNPDYCTPTAPGAGVFSVNAVAYDTSGAFNSCSPTCYIGITYPTTVYFILEAPTSGTAESFSMSYDVHGRWYCYFALYTGLFLGMCICTGCASAIAKKKDAERDSENAPLLHEPAVNVHATTTTTTTQPASYSTTTTQPAPYSAPAPYSTDSTYPPAPQYPVPQSQYYGQAPAPGFYPNAAGSSAYPAYPNPQDDYNAPPPYAPPKN